MSQIRPFTSVTFLPWVDFLSKTDVTFYALSRSSDKTPRGRAKLRTSVINVLHKPLQVFFAVRRYLFPFLQSDPRAVVLMVRFPRRIPSSVSKMHNLKCARITKIRMADIHEIRNFPYYVKFIQHLFSRRML